MSCLRFHKFTVTVQFTFNLANYFYNQLLYLSFICVLSLSCDISAQHRTIIRKPKTNENENENDIAEMSTAVKLLSPFFYLYYFSTCHYAINWFSILHLIHLYLLFNYRFLIKETRLLSTGAWSHDLNAPRLIHGTSSQFSKFQIMYCSTASTCMAV